MSERSADCRHPQRKADAQYRRQGGSVSKRPARITQAEIERAIRAAKKAGLAEIEIKIGDDASIRIPISTNNPVADSTDLVL